MIRVIQLGNGEFDVQMGGEAAKQFVASLGKNPPPHEIVTFRPGAVYDPETGLNSRVLDSDTAARVGGLEERALHYQQVAEQHAKHLAEARRQLDAERQTVLELRQTLLAKEASGPAPMPKVPPAKPKAARRPAGPLANGKAGQ